MSKEKSITIKPDDTGGFPFENEMKIYFEDERKHGLPSVAEIELTDADADFGSRYVCKVRFCWGEEYSTVMELDTLVALEMGCTISLKEFSLERWANVTEVTKEDILAYILSRYGKLEVVSKDTDPDIPQLVLTCEYMSPSIIITDIPTAVAT